MLAAYINTQGPHDVVQYGELPTPEPQPREVRVKVAAVSVNPIDVYIRIGALPLPRATPYIPGCDLAGTVEAVGEGVTRFQVGDRVWGSNQGLLGRQGTFAEYACVHEDWLYSTPANVSDVDAAACALVGITAHLGLFQRAQLQPGETLFVSGGTGGVGAMVVQMAKAVGSLVITTVGSDEKAALAKSLGADVVVNYKTDDLAAAVKAMSPGGIDVWFETQPPSDFDRTVELMARDGRIVVMAGRAARPVLPNGAFYVKGLSLNGFAMFNISNYYQRQCAEQINEWLAGKKLRAVIGKVLPMSRAAVAHQLQEENTLGKAGTLTGKIVLVPD